MLEKSLLHRKDHKTLHVMAHIYCEAMHHSGKELCPECASVMDYADKKVERCHWGAHKPACSQCTTHCFSPDMRGRIREIMRFAGPRMLKKHPILTLFHILNKIFVRPKARHSRPKPMANAALHAIPQRIPVK